VADAEEEWFVDAGGMTFRMIYRSRCDPCGVETESYDLDLVIDWTKQHRHIEMSYRTEFGDVGSLPREVPSEGLDRGES
jgi:hypothetical protein